MCSVILLRRPGHARPLLIGANRDEMLARTWLPPGRHWLEVRALGPGGVDPVGAWFTVAIGDQTWTRTLAGPVGYLSQSSRWQHVGLGAAQGNATIAVHWADGTVTQVKLDKLDQRVTVSHP